jgi:hypothetical protein
MAHGEVSEIIPAPCHAVFDLVHDYSRRLEWDTLLRAAYLTNGHTTPGKGVTSICVGRRALGGIALKTVYVTFDRPKVAAVRMINRPLFFETWAASIHHDDLTAAESRITYRFQFTSRPRLLRFIIEPIMGRIFLRETRTRLNALKEYVARRARG